MPTKGKGKKPQPAKKKEEPIAIEEGECSKSVKSPPKPTKKKEAKVTIPDIPSICIQSSSDEPSRSGSGGSGYSEEYTEIKETPEVQKYEEPQTSPEIMGELLTRYISSIPVSLQKETYESEDDTPCDKKFRKRFREALLLLVQAECERSEKVSPNKFIRDSDVPKDEKSACVTSHMYRKYRIGKFRSRREPHVTPIDILQRKCLDEPIYNECRIGNKASYDSFYMYELKVRMGEFTVMTEGQAKTKRGAQQAAAIKMLKIPSFKLTKREILIIKNCEKDILDKICEDIFDNYTEYIIQECAKRKVYCHFMKVRTFAPPPFVYKCKVKYQDKIYETTGEADTKKIAKYIASRRMCDRLPPLFKVNAYEFFEKNKVEQQEKIIRRMEKFRLKYILPRSKFGFGDDFYDILSGDIKGINRELDGICRRLGLRTTMDDITEGSTGDFIATIRTWKKDKEYCITGVDVDASKERAIRMAKVSLVIQLIEKTMEMAEDRLRS